MLAGKEGLVLHQAGWSTTDSNRKGLFRGGGGLGVSPSAAMSMISIRFYQKYGAWKYMRARSLLFDPRWESWLRKL